MINFGIFWIASHSFAMTEKGMAADPSCRPELVSGPYRRRMDKFNVNTFLNQICAFITGKILNIPESFEYAQSALQNDMKGMVWFEYFISFL